MNEVSKQKTPLHALHVELGARMAPFAGYDMSIHYPAGVLAEHLHTRKAAGLFDVSHMGQPLIEGAHGGMGKMAMQGAQKPSPSVSTMTGLSFVALAAGPALAFAA